MDRAGVQPGTVPLGRWVAHTFVDGPILTLRVEDDIEGFPDWRSVFEFRLVGGRPILAELKVIPATDRRNWLAQHPRASQKELSRHFQPGTWTAQPQDLTSLSNGIPGRL